MAINSINHSSGDLKITEQLTVVRLVTNIHHSLHAEDMNIVDQELTKAERDASPERFPDGIPTDVPKEPEQVHSPEGDTAKRRDTTTSLRSTTASSSFSIVREPVRMSRINTQRSLDRHPVELDRIETHRTQHGSTVGRTNTSRKSKKLLPNFGGGKDFPPQLPAQEEYVVEFDGPDDPMHPQNWPLRKK